MSRRRICWFRRNSNKRQVSLRRRWWEEHGAILLPILWLVSMSANDPSRMYWDLRELQQYISEHHFLLVMHSVLCMLTEVQPWLSMPFHSGCWEEAFRGEDESSSETFQYRWYQDWTFVSFSSHLQTPDWSGCSFQRQSTEPGTLHTSVENVRWDLQADSSTWKNWGYKTSWKSIKWKTI